MKHQIAAMRAMAGPEERERYLSEIEGAVRIYDSVFQTGNKVLDTVLTEKSLTCEANQITLSCVADGGPLAFVDAVDLYSMIGNALDNAIEGVRSFDEKENGSLTYSSGGRTSCFSSRSSIPWLASSPSRTACLPAPRPVTASGTAFPRFRRI